MAPIIKITEIGRGLKPKGDCKRSKWEAKRQAYYQQGGCQQVFSGSAPEERFSAPDYQHYHGRRNDGFHKPSGSELLYLDPGGEEAKHRKSGSRIQSW